MSHNQKSRRPLPSDLGELFGFSESSGTWIALVLSLGVLVALIWAFAAAS